MMTPGDQKARPKNLSFSRMIRIPTTAMRNRVQTAPRLPRLLPARLSCQMRNLIVIVMGGLSRLLPHRRNQSSILAANPEPCRTPNFDRRSPDHQTNRLNGSSLLSNQPWPSRRPGNR